MRLSRVLEQHIAVFGERGSGKTVLVSCFYGGMQEPQFLRESLFDVTADDPGQGHQLHKNYLGMKESARLPQQTRFLHTRYAFSLKLRDKSVKGNKSQPFDAVRLVWHDYPGEWFEVDVSGPDEAQRRVDAFKSLLGSDVAILLVDGQRLLDNAGEEERYLKSVLGSFRNGLLRIGDQLLEDGKPLVKFPRIWILALSKADLLPEFDVFRFRDLVIGRAAEDLGELRRVLQGLVDSPDALAVGEDFLLLSSAKFEPNRIEVSERIGLDLILALAAMLPFERHIRWVQQKQLAAKVVDELLQSAGAFATTLIGIGRFAGPKGLLLAWVGRGGLNATLSAASTLGGDQFKKIHSAALAKHDYMSAVLTGFELDLDDGEEKRVFLRSRR
jgi:hypothetical protein